MRLRWLLLMGALGACDDGVGAPTGPAPLEDPLIVEGGEVSGDWCGPVEIRTPVTVPAGETLTVCAGSHLRMAADPANAIAVIGTLRIAGAPDAPVRIDGAGPWRGLRVGGVLEAEHLVLHGASTGIEGLAGGAIRVERSHIADCDAPLDSAVGAVLRETRITGGGSLRLTGGLLDMQDVLLDLEHPVVPPDCTRINGGGLRLSHVRFTGCHCPLHIDAAPDGVEVEDSVFDGATNPVMIARAAGVLRRSHFAGSGAHLVDIGGNIDVELEANWFEGDAPLLQTSAREQFSGLDGWRAEPYATAGPRALD